MRFFSGGVSGGLQTLHVNRDSQRDDHEDNTHPTDDYCRQGRAHLRVLDVISHAVDVERVQHGSAGLRAQHQVGCANARGGQEDPGAEPPPEVGLLHRGRIIPALPDVYMFGPAL